MLPADLDPTKAMSSEIEHDTRRIKRCDEKDRQGKQNKFSGQVLVAEDVETNQILAKALLSRMGLDVTVAADGHEVVQMALG